MLWRVFWVPLMVLGLLAAPVFSAESDRVAEVGVRALMKAPAEYSQQIKVSGVVSQVVEDANILGLIDLQEFKDCDTVTCASLVLPVRWEGAMPEVGQQLTSTGRIQKEGDRYLFIASELVVISSD